MSEIHHSKSLQGGSLKCVKKKHLTTPRNSTCRQTIKKGKKVSYGCYTTIMLFLHSRYAAYREYNEF